jgi:hypothetical protein
MDVSAEYNYQQFAFQPGDAGAQFIKSETDGIAIQPSLIQMRAPVSSTPEAARERSTTIFRLLDKRLRIDEYLQTGIKVVAHVPVTGSAKGYIGDRLIQSADRIADLGPDFFAGGVKFRSVRQLADALVEENLQIEPYIADDGFLILDYDVQRHQAAIRVDDLSMWLDEAFAFVRDRAMRLLSPEEE